MISVVEFDVFCLKPNDEAPVYRLWVDDTLFTERAFRWNTHDKYIRERLTIDSDYDAQHHIRLEKISGIGDFKAINLSAHDEQQRDLKSKFRLSV